MDKARHPLEDRNRARSIVQALLTALFLSTVVVRLVHSSCHLDTKVGYSCLFGLSVVLIEFLCLMIFLVPGFAVAEALWLAATMGLVFLIQTLPIAKLDDVPAIMSGASAITFRLAFKPGARPDVAAAPSAATS